MAVDPAKLAYALGHLPIRALTADDAPALARLMHAAYAGTVDDGGETMEETVGEVDRLLAGEYGEIIWTASFAVDADPEGATPGGDLAAVSIATLWRRVPLIAFCLTHPSAQRHGYAIALVRATAAALAQQGHRRVHLVVTRGNTAAERLYERLGFVDFPLPPDPDAPPEADAASP
jgi:GNAT superfamily N-acetyltransferase